MDKAELATSDESLRRQIEAVILDSEEFHEIERRLARYCPFEAMNVGGAEIRHSAFIAHCLDPTASHGFGDGLLRAFLDAVLQDVTPPPGLSRLDLHLLDLDAAEVRREAERIDILAVVRTARLVVAIEIKLGAKEGDDQTRRYAEKIFALWPTVDAQGERWRHLLLFMTINGEKAKDQRWLDVTYEPLLNAIEGFLAGPQRGDALAWELLGAYGRLLRRRIVDDTTLEELVRTLWKEHPEALEFIAENRPDDLGDVLDRLRAGRDALMRELGDAAGPLVNNASGKRGLVFGFAELDGVPGIKSGSYRERVVMLSVERRQGKTLDAYLLLGPSSDFPSREAIWNVAKAHAGKSTHKLKEQWNQLAKKELLKAGDPDLDRGDLDAVVRKVKRNLRDFLAASQTKAILDAIKGLAPQQAP